MASTDTGAAPLDVAFAWKIDASTRPRCAVTLSVTPTIGQPRKPRHKFPIRTIRPRLMSGRSHETVHWIELVKAGDSQAQTELWHRYFERLVAAVRARVIGTSRAVRDEEDIALSVLDSFYDAAANGRFPTLRDPDDLWHLLLRMASRKVVDKRRHETRQRRGGGRDPQSIDAVDDAGRPMIEVAGDQPTPEMIASMRESMDQFFAALDVGPLRDLAGAKLEGHSNAELAGRFECSERTIERRLHLIRQKCLQHFARDDESTPSPTADSHARTDR